MNDRWLAATWVICGVAWVADICAWVTTGPVRGAFTAVIFAGIAAMVVCLTVARVRRPRS